MDSEGGEETRIAQENAGCERGKADSEVQARSCCEEERRHRAACEARTDIEEIQVMCDGEVYVESYRMADVCR